MTIDKDILIKNNKIYSPDTCIFVPNKINSLFTKRQNSRGNFQIGVSIPDKQYITYKAELNIGNGRKKYIGNYQTPEEAFQAYKIAKEEYIKQVADEYKNRIPKKLYDAMYNYQVEITD